MKLHEVPDHTKIRIIPGEGGTQHPPSHREFEASEVLDFHYIDGMYSYCTDMEGNMVHLVAWQEVEIVE